MGINKWVILIKFKGWESSSMSRGLLARATEVGRTIRLRV